MPRNQSKASFNVTNDGKQDAHIVELLDIVYDKHAIFAHCNEEEGTQEVFILTRAQSVMVDSDLAVNISTAVNRVGLGSVNLTLIDQQDCPAVENITLANCNPM